MILCLSRWEIWFWHPERDTESVSISYFIPIWFCKLTWPWWARIMLFHWLRCHRKRGWKSLPIDKFLLIAKLSKNDHHSPKAIKSSLVGLAKAPLSLQATHQLYQWQNQSSFAPMCSGNHPYSWASKQESHVPNLAQSARVSLLLSTCSFPLIAVNAWWRRQVPQGSFTCTCKYYLGSTQLTIRSPKLQNKATKNKLNKQEGPTR